MRRLSEYAGRPVILYFYPKDDTPGCTKEACSFTDNLPRFASSKAAVLGVSILDEKSKARFADKYKIGFPLLADPDHEVAENYGTWQKKSRYGRSYMGIVRTTFLIDRSGKVAKRWDNVWSTATPRRCSPPSTPCRADLSVPHRGGPESPPMNFRVLAGVEHPLGVFLNNTQSP